MTIYRNSFKCKSVTFKIKKSYIFMLKNNACSFRCGKTGYKNLSKKYQGQTTKES